MLTSISTTSPHFLNTFRHGNSTTSLNSLCQYPSALSEEKFFLITNLNLPWHNLEPLCPVLLLVTGENRQYNCLYQGRNHHAASQMNQKMDAFFGNLETWSQIPVSKWKTHLHIFFTAHRTVFSQYPKMHTIICHKLS